MKKGTMKNNLFNDATPQIIENMQQKKTGRPCLKAPTKGFSIRVPISITSLLANIDVETIPLGIKIPTNQIMISALLFYYYKVFKKSELNNMVELTHILYNKAFDIDPEHTMEELLAYKPEFEKLVKLHTGE